EGIVPGGGVALMRSAAASLENLRGVPEEEQVGVTIIKKAVQEPARWIATNAGVEGSIVLDRMRNNKGSYGFNAATEEYVDLMKAGIIDPTKVVRTEIGRAHV